MEKHTPETWVYDEEGINYDDIPEITDWSKAVRNHPRLVKIRESIRTVGKYYTRAFNYREGTVEITEVDAFTNKSINSIVVSIEEAEEMFSKRRQGASK